MNGAKILVMVMVMTGMLIALLGVLVVGLSLGWHKSDDQKAVIGTGSVERAFDLLDLNQPTGSVIEQVAEVSGWAALTVTGGGLPPRVFLIDPQTGNVRGEITLNAPSVRQPSANQGAQ